MPSSLVIVESPAKARTISGYLGDDYVVESSIGHIRDLPRNAADVPAAYKGEKWARLGIDVDNDFKPLYVVSNDKKDQVKKLKQLLKDVDELYLATDEDREGEAIAWHLIEVLNPTVPVRRMVFHEITPDAIQDAIDNPRDLDRRLVDAQEARRMLDRLYGYEVSPVLWKKVMPQLSAGRVQSVATRIVVERERERMAFVSASYWDLTATFSGTVSGGSNTAHSFEATIVELDSKRVATGRDFGQNGQLSRDDVALLDAGSAQDLASDLDGKAFTVRSVESRPYRRRPAAPFMTSTFQQEAGRKLRMSSAQAMRSAQSLYEQGYITYMRTDSTTLSDTAMSAARAEIRERYGADHLPDTPRVYTKKVKNAQEAHEAIRPAGDVFKSPQDVASEVNGQDARVYELIWQRTIASQMTDATGETRQLRLAAASSRGQDVVFGASGTVIAHQGFRRVYVESQDDGDSQDENERRLPNLTEGDEATASDLSADGHETQPPSRYTEASLVKRMEELGVGRPSTYASIMGTIQNRGYVWKKGSALVPSFTAFAVISLLEQHFPGLVDYAFTARMEDDLDSIASGSRQAVPWLSNFYFGDETGPPAPNGAANGDTNGHGRDGLQQMVSERLGDIDARAVNSIPIGPDENGELIVARVGRYGPYLQRGEDNAGIPDDLAPDELTLAKAVELIEAPSGDRQLGEDPETGMPVYVKAGRFGPYVQMGEVSDDGPKPKTSSLFQNMSVETLTFEEAMKLLSLPRVIGAHPEDGEEITVLNGRYGPYLKKGNDSRSLESEEQLFTITLDQCVTILAQPKRRRGQTVKPPLKELGVDPISEKPMVVKEGRWGPYVTDGETNASLRKGDDPEEIDDVRASELLADRRARGPVKKKATKKKAAKKKATKKKATKKKATKKKATKKKTAAKKKAPAKKAAEPAPSEDEG
ncbi:MAG: type I DNA topoisomerase [Actinomycetia bacterium]|nr:type I DNA topoisomerase [Actinomycetes bacterium]